MSRSDPPTLRDAIGDLYNTAVVDSKKQSSRRLDALTDYCIDQLGRRGLRDAKKEFTIDGIGRRKKWDVAWEYDKKVRLGISLKSIISNVSGTVPNRIDDMMGEVANIQLYSPEIVIGYIAIVNVSDKSDERAYSEFHRNVKRLSVRSPPSWAPSTIEASLIVKVRFGDAPELLDVDPEPNEFFDRIAEAVNARNPGLGDVP